MIFANAFKNSNRDIFRKSEKIILAKVFAYTSGGSERCAEIVRAIETDSNTDCYCCLTCTRTLSAAAISHFLLNLKMGDNDSQSRA